jgi:sodium/proline symporter
VGNDPEKIFMVMINGLFNTNAGARIFAGILLSAIMAAIMSTADSQLLVSASAFSNDLYKVVLRKRAGNGELVMVSRLAVGAVALAALAMAMDTSSDFFKVVMKMVAFAWAGFGAAFGPLMLLALFWRRTTLAGAVAGMVTGTVACFVWKFILSANSALVAAYPVFGLYELAPAFFLATLAIVAVSLLSKRPPKEVEAQFDRLCD